MLLLAKQQHQKAPIMTRRPSLAESMKSVQNAPAPAPPPLRAAPERAGEGKPYFAATREGLKRITVAVNPDEHKKLKRLAVDTGRSIEDLMREALADLFAKHAE
jgi:cell envelope opacity-associated protein A